MKKIINYLKTIFSEPVSPVSGKELNEITNKANEKLVKQLPEIEDTSYTITKLVELMKKCKEQAELGKTLYIIPAPVIEEYCLSKSEIKALKKSGIDVLFGIIKYEDTIYKTQVLSW